MIAGEDGWFGGGGRHEDSVGERRRCCHRSGSGARVATQRRWPDNLQRQLGGTRMGVR